MAYQIRHTEYGIFQGTFMGLLYWYTEEDCECPEQGLVKYESEAAAQHEIDMICKEAAHLGFDTLTKDKFVIEPFDEVLQARCMALLNYLRCSRRYGNVIN